MITYRLLAADELPLIQAQIEENGGALPDQNMCVAAAAFNDEGRVVGFAVLQYVPHLEPVLIDEDYRAKVNWREFQKLLEGLFESGSGGYYAFASNDKVAKLCIRAGMTEVPMKAFRKELK